MLPCPEVGPIDSIVCAVPRKYFAGVPVPVPQMVLHVPDAEVHGTEDGLDILGEMFPRSSKDVLDIHPTWSRSQHEGEMTSRRSAIGSSADLRDVPEVLSRCLTGSCHYHRAHLPTLVSLGKTRVFRVPWMFAIPPAPGIRRRRTWSMLRTCPEVSSRCWGDFRQDVRTSWRSISELSARCRADRGKTLRVSGWMPTTR